jgi:uncharacterized phage infection (PIP) family protein YhgE
MSKLEAEVDKNLAQMNINYELLHNQGKKINKINNGLEHIENNNSISRKILKRLNDLFYRFTNPLKFKEYKFTINSADNTINSADNTINSADNTINSENDTINSEEKDQDDIIIEKIYLMKNIAYKMNEKIDEQNEILYETQEKMDTCNEGIKKNSKLISELI